MTFVGAFMVPKGRILSYSLERHREVKILILVYDQTCKANELIFACRSTRPRLGSALPDDK